MTAVALIVMMSAYREMSRTWLDEFLRPRLDQRFPCSRPVHRGPFAHVLRRTFRPGPIAILLQPLLNLHPLRSAASKTRDCRCDRSRRSPGIGADRRAKGRAGPVWSSCNRWPQQWDPRLRRGRSEHKAAFQARKDAGGSIAPSPAPLDEAGYSW